MSGSGGKDDNAQWGFAVRHSKGIYFIVLSLCAAGIYCALTMPSAVFPQTNFPRVVIELDNGVMPGDEMMATITRPVEEGMKDIQGVTSVRSSTGRGSGTVDVFFGWSTDMVQAELFVLTRLAQIRNVLPASVTFNVHRLNFSAFPIAGISLTSKTRGISELWEAARYTIKPKFLRIPGVARVDLTGGSMPEIHVVVDPAKLQTLGLTLTQITDALNKTNLVASAGLHEEGHLLYLTLVDGRAHSLHEIENLAVGAIDDHPLRIKDFATVKRGLEPVNTVVTSAGENAVLINVRSQPDGSTLAIADHLKESLADLRRELPAGMKLAFFYDQSLLVRESVQSVWEAIVFGLILSVAILFIFLRNWGTTLVAATVIPVTVLVTLIAMKLLGMSYNLMTLGGIAAAIGLVIDDAIVVTEAIYAKMAAGLPRHEAIYSASKEIFVPLVGSTLAPVVVFVPMAFLDGVPGVFFRALAIAMAIALLVSLALALSLTPALASQMVRVNAKDKGGDMDGDERYGFIMRRVVWLYELAVRAALRNAWVVPGLIVLLLLGSVSLYWRLKSDFLPEMDEGGFVIDYVAPPGTSLSETNRALLDVEEILKATPEVESFSRRTGTALGFQLVEPNEGDFMIKLKPERKRKTQVVIAELRKKLKISQSHLDWEFPGILSDLIGDLTYSPEPVEIKLFSPDLAFLKKKAPSIMAKIRKVEGIVDYKPGLKETGPSISLRVRSADAQRFGLDADSIAKTVNTALLGQTSSSVLEGDRVVNIRVKLDPKRIRNMDALKALALRTPGGATVLLSQVADVVEEPGELELHRDDLRQNVSITARLEGRDLGSGMNQIRDILSKDDSLPAGSIEYGGLYKQQQDSFKNLIMVMLASVVLIFTLLLLEFRTFLEPIAILIGALLTLFGTILSLWLTDTTVNIISLLGAIIGMGIVHKNGILMLDYVDVLRAKGLSLEEALVGSGRRRLRPVLMTSMAAALGMLPLAYGVGSGADMLKPMAVAVIGALCISVLLSLIATPALYALMRRSFGREKQG